MSRSRPDRVCAVLCPDQLQVVRPGRRWPRSAATAHAESFAGDEDGPPWQAAARAFERFLAGGEAGTGTIDVVLSNHFVRYLLLPWNAQVADEEEMRHCAAALFEDIHGEVSAHWDVAVSAESPGAPRLAAAVDASLLAAVRSAVATTRLRLLSTQPYLMAAYNRIARAHTGGDFVFLLLETGRACVVAAQEGRWCHVGTAAAPEYAPALASLLAREMQLADLQGDALPPVYVHAAHRPDLALAPVCGAEPRMLQAPPLPGLEAAGGACALAASLA